MPPHLHPRSRLTSSLFATTLFASFFVVALPHVLPCPAPRVAFADSDSEGSCPPGKRRRRRKVVVEKVEGEGADGLDGDFKGVLNGDGDEGLRKVKRECPVPKPGGLVGEILGFGKREGNADESVGSSTGEKGERPP